MIRRGALLHCKMHVSKRQCKACMKSHNSVRAHLLHIIDRINAQHGKPVILSIRSLYVEHYSYSYY